MWKAFSQGIISTIRDVVEGEAWACGAATGLDVKRAAREVKLLLSADVKWESETQRLSRVIRLHHHLCFVLKPPDMQTYTYIIYAHIPLSLFSPQYSEAALKEEVRAWPGAINLCLCSPSFGNNSMMFQTFQTLFLQRATAAVEKKTKQTWTSLGEWRQSVLFCNNYRNTSSRKWNSVYIRWFRTVTCRSALTQVDDYV